MIGPCAKTQVMCLIVGKSGRGYVGTNSCENPQVKCPREIGEGYEKCRTICRQIGHAEITALIAAGEDAMGGRAYLWGHDHFCANCQKALFAAGILAISVVK